MQITGLVVKTRPERLKGLGRALSALPGVQVHLVREDGNLVVTAEGDDEDTLTDTITRIATLDGVLSAALVYQYADSRETEAST